MIDLHCHMLPGIDDGAQDLDQALEMARIALDDGITLTVCTPHIYQGLYHNDATKIRDAVDDFARRLREADVDLQVTAGADIQAVPELTDRLKAGIFPTLHGSRYFLFEPPHHTVPAAFAQSIFNVLACGYVPVITHPERLTWLDTDHYRWFADAARQGAWLQVTAGALTGRYGDRAKYWSQRFVADGVVHLLATDAHGVSRRPPLLAEGRDEAAKLIGAEEADRMVNARPRSVIDNSDPVDSPLPPSLIGADGVKPSIAPRKHWLARIFSPSRH